MYFPVRCFSCGAPIAQLWDEYQNRIKKGEKAADILNDLKVKRICCRRMFLSHVEIADEIIKYDKF